MRKKTKSYKSIAFANKLKELRTESYMTQNELSEASGIILSTIGDYEIGKRYPKYDNLEKLAKVFGITVDELTNNGKYIEINNTARGKNISIEHVTNHEACKGLSHKYDKLSDDNKHLINDLIDSLVEYETHGNNSNYNY